MTKQLAPARSRRHGQQQAMIDALENCVASTAITELIDALRSATFDDPYIAASLLAGAKSLIRDQRDKRAWSTLLEQMAAEIALV